MNLSEKNPLELKLSELLERIKPADETVFAEAQAHWDGISKPLRGLGLLETLVSRIAALTGNVDVHIDKRAVLVLCADNGVVCEGVTQSDASITAAVAGELLRGSTSVCNMARAARAEVIPVDMGMLSAVPGVRDCHIARGTGNIAVEEAMTRQQALEAILCGIELVRECKETGAELIATGEMGIGNTTTSSAVASVLLNLPVETVTGRGAGLSDAGLLRKKAVIAQAVEVNKPNADDALDVLHKLGGFDIAGMTGIFLGGALYRVPVLIDGLISSIAALIAYRLCPNANCAMLASHCSAEPAAQMILNELGLRASIFADLKLGEGTGAVCLIPLLDLALSVYHDAAAFQESGIEQYELQEGDKR